MAVQMVSISVCERRSSGGMPSTYRVKKVAFGSGFALIAMSNIKLPRDSLKLRPALRPEIAFCRVMFRPSRGRKPWLARVFIMGHGLDRKHTDMNWMSTTVYLTRELSNVSMFSRGFKKRTYNHHGLGASNLPGHGVGWPQPKRRIPKQLQLTSFCCG